MGKSWNLLKERLNAALAPHGAVSDFCRRSGFSRRGVDKWLEGQSAPSIENIDQIAEALGMQPWELITPESAHPPAREPTPEECLKILARAINASDPPINVRKTRQALADQAQENALVEELERLKQENAELRKRKA